jgi:kynureninase
METQSNPFLLQAKNLDVDDALAGYRSQFYLPDEGLIYLDGNSLGRLPLATRELMRQFVDEQWGDRLIRSWGENWYEAPQRIGDKIGQLIGAQPGEVLVCDSTSLNLFKLVLAALALRPGRKKILSDVLNFPTDLYILQGAIELLDDGHTLELLSGEDGNPFSIDQLREALSDDTALIALSTPTFKSGYLHDMAEITRLAHKAGALVCWDFSHAVGVVPIDVTGWQIDFAVGCTYKYLNGGPGSPAFLYVPHRHLEHVQGQPWGWWGHATPFSFALDYQPAADIRRLLVSSPPVLSMLAIEPGIELIRSAGIPEIRSKSIRLGEFFIEMFDALLQPLGYTLGSPRDPQQRGSHISIRHPESYRICQALIDEWNLIPDFREPDNIRLGFAPLYTSFNDLYKAVICLSEVVASRKYESYSHERATIT